MFEHYSGKTIKLIYSSFPIQGKTKKLLKKVSYDIIFSRKYD